MKRILTALLTAAVIVMFTTPLWAPPIDPPDDPEPPAREKLNSGHAYGKVKNGMMGGEVQDTEQPEEDAANADGDPGNSANQCQGGKNPGAC